jgi:hypothetical protein
MNLFGANDTLRLVSTTAANLDVVALHATTDGAATTKGKTRTGIASASTTVIVPAPGVGFERTVYDLKIRNRHASLSSIVTLQDFDGTTAFELIRVTLGPGEALVYDGISGWSYLNAQGIERIASSGGLASPLIGVEQINQLAADVTNSNAVANTMQDITGLQFPMVANGRYTFRFMIDYTAAATTTGARFGISSPVGAARLAYRSAYGLTTTSESFNQLAATFDQPAGANASSPNTGGNIAVIEGIITCGAAGGDLIARFASEIAASAIVAKAGSHVKWLQLS